MCLNELDRGFAEFVYIHVFQRLLAQKSVILHCVFAREFSMSEVDEERRKVNCNGLTMDHL